MGSLHHIVLALVAGHGAAVRIDDRGRVFAELQVLQLPLQIPSGAEIWVEVGANSRNLAARDEAACAARGGVVVLSFEPVAGQHARLTSAPHAHVLKPLGAMTAPRVAECFVLPFAVSNASGSAAEFHILANDGQSSLLESAPPGDAVVSVDLGGGATRDLVVPVEADENAAARAFVAAHGLEAGGGCGDAACVATRLADAVRKRRAAEFAVAPVVPTRRVPIVTLEWVFDHVLPPGADIAFLKIDAQGSGLDVWASARRHVRRVRGVLIDANLDGRSQLYAGQNGCSATLSFARGMGYHAAPELDAACSAEPLEARFDGEDEPHLVTELNLFFPRDPAQRRPACGAWLAANGMEVEDVYTVGLPNQLPTCGPADECAACEGPCAVFFSPDACTCADSRINYRN